MKYLLFVLLLLVSCSEKELQQPKQYARDGYVFDHKEYEHTEVTIKFVLMKNENDRHRAFEQFGEYWDMIAGYTVQSADNNECIVYIRDSAWMYQPEVIGHEVSHCIWGKWHPTARGLQ